MAALDAAATLRAASDVHAKLSDDRALHGQLFLIVRRDPLEAHGAVTVWAPRGQCVVGRIDLRRRAASNCSFNFSISRRRRCRSASDRRRSSRSRSFSRRNSSSGRGTTGGEGFAGLRHTAVMPECRSMYKREMRVSCH
jgi:hypothetical protein